MGKFFKGCATFIGAIVILGVVISLLMPKEGAQPLVSSSGVSVTASAPVSSVASTEPLARFTVKQLTDDYEANALAAENKYKGKKFEVTGTVDNIDKDILGDVYVKLTDGSPYALKGVQAYFKDKKEIEKLSSLKKGDKIIIVGEAGSFTLLSLAMNNCFLTWDE